MDKTRKEILKEIEAEIAVLKKSVASLEEKLALFVAETQKPEPESAPIDFTGLDISDIVLPEPEVKEDLPPEDSPKELDLKQFRWSADLPSARVKNIRSGISLQDRALFIGTLFKEDFLLYDATVSALNEMETLDQAAAYLLGNFPEWNFSSDVVYNFIMAVRKKLG